VNEGKQQCGGGYTDSLNNNIDRESISQQGEKQMESRSGISKAPAITVVKQSYQRIG
jgi:hypothetical protein